MKKLFFLVCAAVILCACKSAPKGEAKAPAPKAWPKVGIQLYSLRSDCEKDLEGVLKALSEDGYDGVELAGFYQYTPEYFKKLCDKYSLKIISAHVGRKELVADPVGQAKLYASLGCKYVALPWAERGMDLPGAPGYHFNYLDDLRTVSKALKDEGIQLLYHSHDFEFVDYNGKLLIDVLLDDCGKDVLQSELDTCWCHVAGTDPSEFMLAHKGFCPLVHFKDYVGTPGGNMYALIGKESEQGEKAETFEYRPVGDGKLDLPGMLKAAKKAGTKWVIVEQDEPSPGTTSLECAKKSIKNVRKALKSL